MNGQGDLINRITSELFLFWQGNTTVPEDNGVFFTLLQLIPDWVLNSRKKSMAARVCALAKSQRTHQMDFTSQWISGCYADHAVENTFLVAQPMNWLHTQVKRHSSWQCSDSGGHSKRESLLVRVRRHTPKGRSSRHPSAHRGPKNGVSPNFEKCCVIAKIVLLRARPV